MFRLRYTSVKKIATRLAMLHALAPKSTAGSVSRHRTRRPLKASSVTKYDPSPSPAGFIIVLPAVLTDGNVAPQGNLQYSFTISFRQHALRYIFVYPFPQV